MSKARRYWKLLMVIVTWGVVLSRPVVFFIFWLPSANDALDECTQLYFCTYVCVCVCVCVYEIQWKKWLQGKMVSFMQPSQEPLFISAFELVGNINYYSSIKLNIFSYKPHISEHYFGCFGLSQIVVSDFLKVLRTLLSDASVSSQSLITRVSLRDSSRMIHTDQ